MYLTILGNNGPFPAPNGACSSYLLESDSGETKLLIDAGTGSLARLMEIARPETLTAVVLSHLHFDHISDLLPMQYALQFSGRERPLPVFLPRRPERVRSLLECPYYDLFDHEDIAVGEMRLSFIPAAHPVEGSCVAVACDGAKFVFTETRTAFPLWNCSRTAAICCWQTLGFRRRTGRKKSRTSPPLSAARWPARRAPGRCCSPT